MQHLVWLQNAKCQCKLCGLCNCAVMARWIWPGLKNFGTGCSSKKLDILSNEKLRYFRFTLNPFDSLYINLIRLQLAMICCIRHLPERNCLLSSRLQKQKKYTIVPTNAFENNPLTNDYIFLPTTQQTAHGFCAL